MADIFKRLFYRTAYRTLLLLWRLFKSRGRGVTVLIRHHDSIVLVTTSYRPGRELPGGGVGRGETPRDAAARELEEELGLRVAPARLAILLEHAFNKHRRRIEETIFLLELDDPPELAPDGVELVEAGLFPLAGIKPGPEKISLQRALRQLAIDDAAREQAS